MTTFKSRRWSILPAALLLASASFGVGHAIELKDAVQLAVDSNPQISQADQDEQAIQFERKQAQGLYLPRVSVDAEAGVERLENPTRRLLGLDTHTLYPVQGEITGEEVVFDSGNRSNELKRQASRVDGAAKRVLERSEFVGLETVREYLNYLLQQRVLADAQDNVAYHDQLAQQLGEGVKNGSISIADQQQAEERLQAARARVTQAQEDLVAAAIAFETRTGVPLDSASMPAPVADKLPPTMDDAVGQARTNNPRVKIAMADIDAATAYAKEVKSNALPKVSIVGSAREGNDVDGFEGRTTDLQARVVLKWNLYTGGVDQANYQEQVRRASEERYKLHQTVREVEEDVKTSWNRREQQTTLTQQLDTQARVSDDLVNSYGEQFKVGRRSLLDLLDAQNTRYSARIAADTARFAELFAEYRVLAATGQLLSTLGVQPRSDAAANERARFNVPPTAPAELMERKHPG